MKLIVITPSTSRDREQNILKQMLDLGLPTLHIRKPHLSTESLKKYLNNFSKEQLKHIMIHSHHSLLWDYNLKGIHLTKAHKKKQFRSWAIQKIIKLRRGNFSMSTSCNSISSMAASYNEFEYIMLTPVFGQTQEHRPTFSRGTLDIIIEKYPGKLIARGGANIESIAKAYDIGFTGMAFQNFIWKSEDPVGQFIKVLERYKELGIPVE
jgi:thiamine-phosphate pyrophosphorylase